MVERLIERGVDINCRFRQGDTPLTMAIKNNHLGMVALFIHHGANVNQGNSDGIRPLHLAILHERGTLISSLITAGAHVNEIAVARAQQIGNIYVCSMVKFWLQKRRSICPEVSLQVNTVVPSEREMPTGTKVTLTNTNKPTIYRRALQATCIVATVSVIGGLMRVWSKSQGR